MLLRGKLLFCKATEFISTKRAHTLLPFVLNCVSLRTQFKTNGTHDVVSYVTSFAVFSLFYAFSMFLGKPPGTVL